MNCFSIIAIILILGVLDTALAEPRVAVVRVKDIYTELPTTAALALEINTEREKIANDERALKLRKIIGELQELQTFLFDKEKPLDDETRRSLVREYEYRLHDIKTIQAEFENYKSEQEKKIRRHEAVKMSDSLKTIIEMAGNVAKERGYDLVLERSAESNTQLPFILYAKNVPDLTDDVKVALKNGGVTPMISVPESNPPVESKPQKKSRPTGKAKPVAKPSTTTKP